MGRCGACVAVRFFRNGFRGGCLAPCSIERNNVPETVSFSAGVASRYATALFELAKESAELSKVEQDLDALKRALGESSDLRTLISSPIYSRDDQVAAITALAGHMELTPIVTGTLGVMAEKRRLFALPQLIDLVRSMVAAENGEVTAQVSVPKPLSGIQVERLGSQLGEVLGSEVKKVNVEQTVDESLVGGLVIRVGSKMVDSSIRSKLSRLRNAMKEVG